MGSDCISSWSLLIFLLRSHAWHPRVCPGSSDLRSHRCLWELASPWEIITLLRCNCHMRSPGSLCVLAIFLAQYSMSPYVYPTGFGRYRFGCSAGPCRRPGFEDRYGANTGLVEPTCMGFFWTTHDSLRAQKRRKPISESCTCSSFSEGLYGLVRIQNHQKIVQTHSAVIRPVWLVFSLCAKSANKDTKLLQTNSGVQSNWAEHSCHFDFVVHRFT